MTVGARARTAIQAANQTGTVTISQVLDGHVLLDLACLDRVYLNAQNSYNSSEDTGHPVRLRLGPPRPG